MTKPVFMNDLTQMWDALARYQPYADKDGHGETWRAMCEQRTEAAAEAATATALKTWDGWTEVAEAAACAANAANAEWEGWAEDALYWSGRVIGPIERAIKDRNHD